MVAIRKSGPVILRPATMEDVRPEVEMLLLHEDNYGGKIAHLVVIDAVGNHPTPQMRQVAYHWLTSEVRCVVNVCDIVDGIADHHFFIAEGDVEL